LSLYLHASSPFLKGNEIEIFNHFKPMR
jgi:hypothetical protein